MKLQFKHQPFQAEAAAAVCDVFRGQSLCAQAHRQGLGAAADRPLSLAGTGTGLCNQPLAPELTDARILKNLHAVQRRAGLPLSKALAGPGINLSVEMETGTGKTYTYVKTIYELNARYGWSRFIIVVPSVAVREGVYRSLQTTQEHFAGEYGRRLRFFIYNSDRLAQVDRFASDSAIQVMIINMQAFNSGRNQRIIDQRPDSFRGRRPIDVIAATRPILIIDEPQSVEGRQTRESLRKFNALFTLRYSATHREAYNMVYRLDALDAYNRHLVKRIAALGVTFTSSPAAGGFVYLEGVDLSRDRAPAARIGFEVKGASDIQTVVKQLRRKADLFAASNGLAEYADRYVVAEIDGRDSSVTFLNGLKLYAGQFSGGEERTALQRRVQIRETIRTHLRRERELYSRGVKVLSLFFIDEVSKYRLYDGDSGSGRSGEYAKMFEAEYVAVAEAFRREIDDPAYRAYLDGIDARETHQGYFSVDRRKGRQARFVEGKIDHKSRTSSDADAYDLIMRDKERLLSLDEPVRFLFSHSALREGWDNPNVFQICMLKPQTESEIRSRQEIGRGLRLCVNQEGERMDESVLGGAVQELNKLTLITDMEFGRFAEALQQGLAASLAGRPRTVEPGLFAGRLLTGTTGAWVRVTRELAEEICAALRKQGYVKDRVLTGSFFADRDRGTVRLGGSLQDLSAAVAQVLSGVYTPRAIPAENAHGGNVTARADPEKLQTEAFRSLWARVGPKSFYTVSFDTRELIGNVIQALDAHLQVTPVSVRTVYGEQATQLQSREQLLQGRAFRRRESRVQAAGPPAPGGVRYDLVGRLVEETGLTRTTAAAILQGIAPETFAMFRLNPEDFLLQASRLINREKAAAVVRHITYHRLDASYDAALFTNAVRRGRLGCTAVPAAHSISDYVICDTDRERAFAEALEASEAVRLYVRLPKSFFIPTPVGRYTPDWAIALRDRAGDPVYFVAETSGKAPQPQGVEAAKLQCARAHFAAVSGGEVMCGAVRDLDELLRIVG